MLLIKNKIDFLIVNGLSNPYFLISNIGDTSLVAVKLIKLNRYLILFILDSHLDLHTLFTLTLELSNTNTSQFYHGCLIFIRNSYVFSYSLLLEGIEDILLLQAIKLN